MIYQSERHGIYPTKLDTVDQLHQLLFALQGKPGGNTARRDIELLVACPSSGFIPVWMLYAPREQMVAELKKTHGQVPPEKWVEATKLQITEYLKTKIFECQWDDYAISYERAYWNIHAAFLNTPGDDIQVPPLNLLDEMAEYLIFRKGMDTILNVVISSGFKLNNGKIDFGISFTLEDLNKIDFPDHHSLCEGVVRYVAYTCARRAQLENNCTEKTIVAKCIDELRRTLNSINRV